MWFQRCHAGMGDTELVSLVARGNEGAFAEVLNRHQDAVYQFGFRFLGDASEAEDITQETFLRLFRMAESYQHKASLRAFLLRITRNLCIDFIRKKKPELMEVLPESVSRKTPMESLEQAESIEYLNHCIDALPDNQRMAILLRHGSDLRYQEIAHAMGVTVSAVESLLVRARKTLRRQMI